MKNTLKTIVLGVSILFTSIFYGQDIVQPSDLEILVGNWQGSLTYIDYGTNKPYTMPANLTVKKGKSDYQLSLLISYPKEPNANSKDKIKISKDGKKINKIEITSVERLPNEQLIITAAYAGKDANKKAQIRNIYSIGKNKLSIRKEVMFNGTKEWMMRNEYNYKR